MRVQVTYHCGGAAHRYRLRTFTAQPDSYCCEKMAVEWGNTVDVSLCGFPSWDNIKPVLITAHFLHTSEVVSAALPFKHCPWCAEQVEVLREIDMTSGTDRSPKEGEPKVTELNF